MKRKFLIWSALLTVVFGAALLQSCSADDDAFVTADISYPPFLRIRVFDSQ